MFKKIIWATDGSAPAERALPYAKELARRDGGSLLIVHAVETYAGSRAAGLPLYVEEEELQKRTEAQVESLRAEGLDADLKMVMGIGAHAAHAIADAAEEIGADLIVAGTRGHTPLGGLLLGSVTQRLLHIAPCPVMAVPAMNADSRAKRGATTSRGEQG
jgi:nucleotide-binding universal stress UspA family protein